MAWYQIDGGGCLYIQGVGVEFGKMWGDLCGSWGKGGGAESQTTAGDAGRVGSNVYEIGQID